MDCPKCGTGKISKKIAPVIQEVGNITLKFKSMTHVCAHCGFKFYDDEQFDCIYQRAIKRLFKKQKK